MVFGCANYNLIILTVICDIYFQLVLASCLSITTLNGINEIRANPIFTIKSAIARLTHRGARLPIPNTGVLSFAQLTSVIGFMKLKKFENAILKKRSVSRLEPIKLDETGPDHHANDLILLKIYISTSCAKMNAVPDANAIRIVTKGPNSPII